MIDLDFKDVALLKIKSKYVDADYDTSIWLTGLYSHLCTDKAPGYEAKLEMFLAERYVDDDLYLISESFGEAALRQAILMTRAIDLGHSSRNQDIFDRKPTKAEEFLMNEFMMLQKKLFDEVMGNQCTPETGQALFNFQRNHTDIFYWTVLHNNLLRPSVEHRYDDKFPLRANLYMADTLIYARDLSIEARANANYTLPGFDIDD